MFITNYKALNYADWAPVASFITGWIHLGLGSQQVAAAKQKMHKLTPETAANDLKNRRIQKWGAAQEEGWKHIRRGLFAILLPIISNIFFMIYDLIHAHKKALPPAIPTPTPEISKEIKIECTPKPPRVVSEPDHDVVLFKQKFNEVRKSDSVGKFLDSITDFKEYAYLAEEITHHEIELWNLSGHNFFKINEFQDVPAPNNDWLFHFMSALPTDKLGTLLNVLVQREDLGEKFFNRLVNIMDELPERQKQFAALKMCMQCNDEGKYYNLLSSLKDNQPAHQAFAIQYLHTFEDSGELLYAKIPCFVKLYAQVLKIMTGSSNTPKSSLRIHNWKPKILLN